MDSIQLESYREKTEDIRGILSKSPYASTIADYLIEFDPPSEEHWNWYQYEYGLKGWRRSLPLRYQNEHSRCGVPGYHKNKEKKGKGGRSGARLSRLKGF